MIASEPLAAWLADRDAQAASVRHLQTFVAEWSRAPLFNDLEQELHDALPLTPEKVVAAARRFMDRAVDISALMGALLAASRADPFFVPAFQPLSSDVHSGLLLFNNPALLIGFGVTGVDMLAEKKSPRRGATSVAFTGVWNLFRYLKAGNATVSFWEAPPITGDFSAADAGECRLVRRQRFADGDEMLVDGSRETFIVDHADSDILYFQALIRTNAAPLSAEYDSASRRFIGASSTDEAASRVQMMATLLRTMDREDAAPLLQEMLASPRFYTRWHIMRELLALDADLALPDLRRMATHDPHPDVRAAAQQTLAQFFPETPAATAVEPVACPA